MINWVDKKDTHGYYHGFIIGKRNCKTTLLVVSFFINKYTLSQLSSLFLGGRKYVFLLMQSTSHRIPSSTPSLKEIQIL